MFGYQIQIFDLEQAQHIASKVQGTVKEIVNGRIIA